MHAMEISFSALEVEWRRLEVISENLANANVAGRVDGSTYRQLNLVSGPKDNFATYLDRASGIDPSTLGGVAIRGITASDAPPRLVHEPGNALANAQGYVAYPSIDHVQQMTQLMQTVRSYEANIVAMNLAREMYSHALQLGGSS